MTDTFIPLFDQILVKELEPPELRSSGLMVPDTARSRHPPQVGMVLAVGEGVDWWKSAGVEMPVKVGDVVVFAWQTGTYIEVNEEALLVMRVAQLLGVMVTDPADPRLLVRDDRAES